MVTITTRARTRAHLHTLLTGALLVALLLLVSKDIWSQTASAVKSTGPLPGDSGLLTPAQNPPTLKTSAANAATTVTNPIAVTETSPLVVTRGAHLNRTIDPATARPDSITPNTDSFQTYSVEIKTDAPKLDVQYRATGESYRIWVDGHPIKIAGIPAAASTGAFYRVTLTFPSRALRAIRYESDASAFSAFTVSRTDQLVAPVVPGKRAIIIGDSFAEGTGANGRFNSYAQTLCLMAGWDDCWVAGSGGTGYLTNGAPSYQNRVKFRDRIVNDALTYKPDVIVIAGGKNDADRPVADVQSEALTLFTQIRQALPNAEFIVTSPFPSSGPQAQDPTYLQLSSALRTSAAGLADYFLDVTGSNAYLTGTGNSASPNGTGNADTLVGPDDAHPTQLGHDTLAKELFKRYVAQRPANCTP